MKTRNLRIHGTATLNANSTNPSCAIQMSSFTSTLVYTIGTYIRAEFTATNSKGTSTVSNPSTGTIVGQSAPTIAASGLSATSTITTITLSWTALTSGWMLQRSKLIPTRCSQVSFTKILSRTISIKLKQNPYLNSHLFGERNLATSCGDQLWSLQHPARCQCCPRKSDGCDGTCSWKPWSSDSWCALTYNCSCTWITNGTCSFRVGCCEFCSYVSSYRVH